MGYNNIFGSRHRYHDRYDPCCSNRNPRFDSRYPFDRRIAPGRDRYDNWDRRDRHNRYDGCCKKIVNPRGYYNRRDRYDSGY